MQGRNISRHGSSLIRVAAAAAVLLVPSCGYADVCGAEQFAPSRIPQVAI